MRRWWAQVKWALGHLFDRDPRPPACEPGHHVPAPGNPTVCIKCRHTLW